MAGGRPENLVVEKMKDAVPTVQNLGEIDVATAQIVVKSLVHSFFTDPELRLPIYTVKSVQNARINCSANVVRYDPDGGKAEAYRKIKTEEQRKQQKEVKAKAAEEARIQQEEEEARLERERQKKAEEEARQQQELEKNRAESAERQKQHEAAIKDMLKNTRTDEDIAREEAERKQKEEEARKANSGLGGFIKSLW
jgi:flagellar biosynthesis GTPase FlhF